MQGETKKATVRDRLTGLGEQTGRLLETIDAALVLLNMEPRPQQNKLEPTDVLVIDQILQYLAACRGQVGEAADVLTEIVKELDRL